MVFVPALFSGLKIFIPNAGGQGDVDDQNRLVPWDSHPEFLCDDIVHSGQRGPEGVLGPGDLLGLRRAAWLQAAPGTGLLQV